MRATVMYGPGDVRVEQLPDPGLEQPTDALVRVVRTCVCGSDLHPYHSMPAAEQGNPYGPRVHRRRRGGGLRCHHDQAR
jgi:threonine dehydrogenase-like Zn-dependent dehydrogenase